MAKMKNIRRLNAVMPATEKPAPKPMTIERIVACKSDFFEDLQRELESSKAKCVAWAADAINPDHIAYALEWAHSIAPHAAMIRVIGNILTWRDKNFAEFRATCGLPEEAPIAAWYASSSCDDFLNKVRNQALDEALRGARHPAASSSLSSNMMENAKVACWANVEERFRYQMLTLNSMNETLQKEQANA